MKNLKSAWQIADQTGLQELEDACLICMHVNFTAYFKTPLLPGMKCSPLTNLLQREIGVPNEEEFKFTAVVTWVDADSSRKHNVHLPDVLGTISQAQLSINFIVQQLASVKPATNHPYTK